AFVDYHDRPPVAQHGGVGLSAVRGRLPLVSIITVVRNGERFLEQTIRSVIAQDYPYIEYILIDGASTDGTLDIIARHEADVSHWRSEPDSGIYDAMNKGIGLAHGQLIKLLNADDVLLPGAITAAVNAHQEAGAPCVITSDLEIVDAAGTHLKIIDAERFLNPVGAVLHPSWLVHRSLYEGHGLYDPSFRTSSDYELFVRLHSRDVPFHHIHRPLAQFRSGGASSGFGGIADSFKINEHYFGRRVAARTALRHAVRKMRSRALSTLFSSQRLQQLHAWRTRAARRTQRPRAEP
ncbi:MAG TPA: glycosyltransferase family 2 protein, partial [Kofleriaceae bacterium]|nr:glycosyltransferase family 2 protein [Kofleriaceae bacterium]